MAALEKNEITVDVYGLVVKITFCNRQKEFCTGIVFNENFSHLDNDRNAG